LGRLAGRRLLSRLRNPSKLARRAAYLRANGRLDDADRLEVALVAEGRCRSCGRPLTDPESVRLGIGPDCLTKQGKGAENENRLA
jgi:hypothetical protein